MTWFTGSRSFMVVVAILALIVMLGVMVGSVGASPRVAPERAVDPQTVLQFLTAMLALIWSYAGVKMLVGQVLINVVVALAAAQKSGTLDFSKLAEFLTKKLLPFVAVYVVCKVFGESAGLIWLAPAVWTIIEATLAANLIDNLGRLGVPLPEALARVTRASTYQLPK